MGNTPESGDPAPLVYAINRQLKGRVTTTNATPTILFDGTLERNTGYVATLTVIGVDTGNGNIKSTTAVVTCKRLLGGALLVGSPEAVVAPQGDVGTETWAVVGSVSGNDFRITVTGAAGRTIAWSVTGSFISFTPNGR